jgi:hypothetical protein
MLYVARRRLTTYEMQSRGVPCCENYPIMLREFHVEAWEARWSDGITAWFGMMGAGTDTAKSWTNSKIGLEYWSRIIVA